MNLRDTLSRLIVLLFCGLSFVGAEAQFYNGSNVTFGKNRIQHREFLWQYYRLAKQDIYFYEGGKELAAHVGQVAPRLMKQAENELDYVVQDRIDFIVYNTHTDFKQSNIGISAPEDASDIGGTARIVGKKVFVFFDGDYRSFDEQIHAGITQLIVNEMMYGGDLKDAIKNAALLNFPRWYTEGLVSHMSKGWTVEVEEFVRDGILYGDYEQFNHLEGRKAVFAGHSVWKYIADVYGASVIPNVLYMSKVSRSIDSGFLFVLGISIDDLLDEHDLYYTRIFAQQEMLRADTEIPRAYVRNRPGHVYSQYRLSPDGKTAAFVSNILGQYRIFVYDLDEHHRKEVARYKKWQAAKEIFDRKQVEKGVGREDYVPRAFRAYRPRYRSAKRIFKAEHKLDRAVDKSYPVLEWNPQGTELSFITEKKGALYLNTYELKKGKAFSRELFGLEKVLSFDYARDGKRMVLSAVSDGMTDVYLYYLLGNRQERLTSDDFDDLQPRFAFDDKKVVFSSNRIDDTLRTKYRSPILPDTYDIFAMDLEDREAPLERITTTPEYNETSPFQYDSLRYTYISDRGGVNNRYLATYDSVIARIDTTIHYRYFTTEQRLTNEWRSPLEYDVNHNKSRYGLLKYIDGEYAFFFDDIGPVRGEGGVSDTGSKGAAPTGKTSPQVTIFGQVPTENEGVDVEEYIFRDESEVPDIKESSPGSSIVVIEDFAPLNGVSSTPSDSLNAVMPKARNYKINFVHDKMIVQLSNSYLNQFYQPIGAGLQGLTPGLSVPVQAGFSDLFEDRRIFASLLADLQLRDFGYAVQYDNVLKRLDKSVFFNRQTYTIGETDGIPVRLQTNTMRYRLSWPFSEVLSVRADAVLTHQRGTILGRNDFTLRADDTNSAVGGFKTELIFDNTLPKGPNLFNGSRAKLWTEYYHTYDFATQELPSFAVVGFDARHYQKIHRELIAAFRIAGNTSFGDQRLLSVVGGVDNWIFTPTLQNDDTPIDLNGQNYAYQAMVTPLRGFIRNARNGTTAAVTNMEIRWPLITYFSKYPVKSDFLQNFQLVGFSDIGSAWTGSNPYSEENSFNNLEVTGLPSNLSLVLRNQEDPIIYGYGFGLRSRLLGYFVRADWAWGVIDGRTLPREFYLSLNLDF